MKRTRIGMDGELKNKFNIPTIEEYSVNEDFFNPFEEEDDDKPKESKHISDHGQILGIRKESYNPSRIEYTKKGGSYVVKARTHFGANETVEIAPVIILGSEVTAIDGLKNIVYEIDGKRGEWGLVLGYGALYGHSDKPNLVYAYSKKNKLMHFITTRIIHLGEDLTINYGKDYWVARKEFNMVGDHEKGEAAVTRIEPIPVEGSLDEVVEVEPTADTDRARTTNFGEPNSRSNPAVTGHAIKGIGQQ